VGSLGTFAAAKREYAQEAAEPDTFEFCGETFTVRGHVPGMVQLTIGAWFGGQVNGNEGAAALRDVLRHALTAPAQEVDGRVTPEDDSQWQRFYELAVEYDVETEDLAEVAYVLIGSATGRPTERRSTSSTGSSPTSTSSSTSSSDSPA
jgi:hypothetical protein